MEPIGQFANNVPPIVFEIVHLLGLLIGAYFAYRAFNSEAKLLGWAFTLYALGEISYLTYHLDWTTFLFAHTISEVLVLVAVVLVFAAATQSVLLESRATA